MQAHYNALIVVFSITMVVFYFAKPLFIQFIAVEDYVLRRNIWLGVLVAAFLIPNYWVFVLVATVMVRVGIKRDSNPAALYLFLLMVIPPFATDIPTFGLISQLFPLDHLRFLSLAILLPAARGLFSGTGQPGAAAQLGGTHRQGLLRVEVLLLLYCGLQFVLLLPQDSAIASIRRFFLFGIDVLLPYFMLSRGCRTKPSIVDAMASFALAAIVLSCLAAFENLRGWLLFASIEEVWGSDPLTSFLRRGESLRAQVTAGHSLVLGYALAMGLAFWLYLQTKVPTMKMRWLGLLSLVAGLAATLARGPWAGALVIALLFFGLGPNAFSRLLKAFGALSIATAVLLASPLGAEFVDRLPFIGTADQDGSVVYRQRVAAVSWMLIQQNPFFGNLSAGAAMEELRQGEGIIDMVNTYAFIALTYGGVGVGLFVGFFVSIVVSCLQQVKRFSASDPDNSLLGSALAAAIVGSLLIIATVGLYLAIGYLIWAVAGLAVAYAQWASKETPTGSVRQGA